MVDDLTIGTVSQYVACLELALVKVLHLLHLAVQVPHLGLAVLQFLFGDLPECIYLVL